MRVQTRIVSDQICNLPRVLIRGVLYFGFVTKIFTNFVLNSFDFVNKSTLPRIPNNTAVLQLLLECQQRLCVSMIPSSVSIIHLETNVFGDTINQKYDYSITHNYEYIITYKYDYSTTHRCDYIITHKYNYSITHKCDYTIKHKYNYSITISENKAHVQYLTKDTTFIKFMAMRACSMYANN